MMILAIIRRLPQLLELQRERTWQPLEGREMRDITVGDRRPRFHRPRGRGARPGVRLPGPGRDATRGGHRPAARTTRAASSRAASGRVAAPRLPELLAESDFMVLAAAADAGTEDLFDAGMLSPRQARARGSSTSRAAGSSTSGHWSARCATADGGAVLDAFRDEPLPPTSPLYGLPNLIVTPHTSWSSGRVLDRSIELFCDNLRRFAPASRSSTSSTRAPGTETRRCRSPSWGLPGRGKTTVFNTLTRGHAETGGFGGLTVNIGVVKVPDDRLTR